jgi:putative transposase
MKQRSYSQRRACALAGIDPRVSRRKSKRPQDIELRSRMKERASERRRFGDRRLHILLKREGWPPLGRFGFAKSPAGQWVNWKKLYRFYREEGLTVRKRGGRKRANGTRAPITIPQGPNQRWSLHFVSDALADGRRFRILCSIDDFSRECLATVVDTSLSGHRVARELDHIAEMRGFPCLVVSDNHCPAGDLQSKSAERGHRADQQRHAEMAGGSPSGMALHRAGQAHAERVH